MPKKALIVGGAVIGAVVLAVIVLSMSPISTVVKMLGVKEQVSVPVGCLNGEQVIAESVESVVASESALAVIAEHANQLLEQSTPNGEVTAAMEQVGRIALEAVDAVRNLPETASDEGLMGSQLVAVGDYLESKQDLADRWKKAADNLNSVCEVANDEATQSIPPPVEPSNEAPVSPDTAYESESSFGSPSTQAPSSDYGPPADIPAFVDQIISHVPYIECVTTGNSESIGSGVLLDISELTGSSSSILVTNHHVIADCLAGGEIYISVGADEFIGIVDAWDEANDLAVLSGVTAEGALPVGLEPAVGQWVMAVGAPEGIRDSATFGHVSNVAADDPEVGALITSDAVLGPGNSGGPLVNNKGEVIGINSAVWTEATGISLSVPVATLCEQLLSCI